MSVTVSKNIHQISAASVPVRDMDGREPMKKGIVAILGADCDRNYTAAASIRRTLSADMSSKKWLLQNGFLVTSGTEDQLVDSSSSEEESDLVQDDAWKSIQLCQKEMDANWGAINLAAKKENKPPYVHPLVKRSAAALTERSLEICTESLGSETGTKSNLSSETLNDGGKDGEERLVQERVKLAEINPFEHSHVVKYKSYPAGPAPPLPPRLSSAASGRDGAAFYMNTRRENGRLVLEAVAVPPRKVYFHSEREDGRLVLTPIDRKVGDFEEVFGNMEEVAEKTNYYSEDDDSDDEEVEEEEAMESVAQNSKSMPAGLAINLQKHPLSLPPRPPPVARLIPPPPAATANNAYDYLRQIRRTTQNQEMAAMEGNRADYFGHYSPARGCKQDPKRAYLIWEPHCIATS